MCYIFGTYLQLTFYYGITRFEMSFEMLLSGCYGITIARCL